MRFLFLILIIFLPSLCHAEQDTVTLTGSALQTRLESEEKYQTLPFLIIPHKPNYFMPFNYNDKIQQYDIYGENVPLQQIEFEFQISFKMPLFPHIADSDVSLYFAYSQVSLWQAFNSANSSPFRESNYEPELFAQWESNLSLGSRWKIKALSLGLTHQSNGRGEPLSRSWNRFEGRLIAENSNLALALNPWYRIEEELSEDNNPDLLDYYGHGRLIAVYKINQHTVSLTSRNNIESGFSRGSLEGSWSFPVYAKIRGYFKVFSGYGNSMIEYDQYTNTVGFGISMTDWL